MKKDKNVRKKSLPVGRLLFICFAAFALLMLLFNWLFQSVFLDDFYRLITLQKSNTAMSRLESSLKSDPDDTESLEVVAAHYDVCVSVYSDRLSPVYEYDAWINCIIHHLSPLQLRDFYAKTVQNGGKYSETISYIMMQSPLEKQDSKILESVLIIHLVNIGGTEYSILLNAQITPVTAVTETINILLIIITVIMLGLASLLAWLTSRSVASPIKRITDSARQLATGDYSVSFDTASRVREVAQLGETLNFAATELSKVDRLRGELIANVSHDLRTPLTLIGGYGEVMRDIPGENTPENAQIIVDEAKRLSTIVTDVLDLSKLESGAEKLNSGVFCITATIQSILKSYRHPTAVNGDILFNSDANVWVNADEIKICRVIYNILNNAIAFTGDDGKVTITQTLDNNTVRISVADTGAGIPRDELPHIFERYYKVSSDKKNTAKRGGSGLGLSIVKAILDLHSARYGINSGTTGTTVWFELKTVAPPEDGAES